MSIYNTYSMRDEILSNYCQTMIEERGHKLKAVTQVLLTISGPSRAAITHISEVTGKVRSLIAEVAEASVKQTGGLRQVNSAASDMESVTQDLAANSEESSAAINDLRHHIEHIVEMLGGLHDLVVAQSRGADEP